MLSDAPCVTDVVGVLDIDDERVGVVLTVRDGEPVPEVVPDGDPDCVCVIIAESDGESVTDVVGVIGPVVVGDGVIDSGGVLVVDADCVGEGVLLALPPRLDVGVSVPDAVGETLVVVDTESLPEGVGDSDGVGVALSDPVLVTDGVADELSVLDGLDVLLLETAVVVEPVPVLAGVTDELSVLVELTDCEFVDVDDGVGVMGGVGMLLHVTVGEFVAVCVIPKLQSTARSTLLPLSEQRRSPEGRTARPLNALERASTAGPFT